MLPHIYINLEFLCLLMKILQTRFEISFEIFLMFEIVNVDAFLVHENDKTKTDVLLHFVDYRDNSGK